MHEIGPSHYQLLGMLTLVFLHSPRAPLRRSSAPRAPGTCAASSAPSGLATSPNLAVDLGQDIQFGSS